MAEKIIASSTTLHNGKTTIPKPLREWLDKNGGLGEDGKTIHWLSVRKKPRDGNKAIIEIMLV
mgnify:CR=1 FL=1